MISTIPPTIPLDSHHGASEIRTDEALSARLRLWRFHDEYVLGTRLDVLVHTANAALANEAATAARCEIDRLERVFNSRRVDSELSVLNKTGRAIASADLFAVVHLSEQWRRISRGAFDGRMNEVLRLWADGAVPSQRAIERALATLRSSTVTLDPIARRIELSATSLSLDALAKGYIVDAAFNAALRAAPTVVGLAISIGGDIRCWGTAPQSCGWRIGIPDSIRPADNARLVDAVSLNNAAIATSGRGPRDCIDSNYRSTTNSPFTGHPVRSVISASVVASHAADADAIATACLVLSPSESIALVDKLGVAARISDAAGGVHHSSMWPTLRLAAAPAASATRVEPKIADDPNASANKRPSLPPELRWPADWEIGISYVAPERRENDRSADFRTPYMAVWITDEKNRSVNTPIMVGQDPDWHHDNYIWWGVNGPNAEKLIELRSQATALSGRYRFFWGGLDENLRPVPIGKYTLHIETSQERGKHSYRNIVLEIGHERFKKTLPNLPESGGLVITYGHYNDRFKDE